MHKLLLIALLSLAGCTTETTTSSTTFHPSGTPNHIIHLSNGNTIYVYVRDNFTSYPHVSSPPVALAAGKGSKPSIIKMPSESQEQELSQLKCVIYYEVNKQNQVVSVKKEGCI